MRKTFLLSGIFMLIGVYGLIFGAWSAKRKDPCNPVKPPVIITDILGKDVTNDSVWRDGAYIRTRDGVSRKIIIINNREQ